MKTRTIMFLVMLFVLLGVVPIVAQPTVTSMSAEEAFSAFQKTFPWLQNGVSLFVTTGEYHVYLLEVYLRIFEQIREEGLPSCRFKAVTVVLGELHKKLDKSIAAGCARSDDFPPWFILFVATKNKEAGIYIYDVISGRVLTRAMTPKVKLLLF